MGLVYADIELVNAYDEEMARRHIIGKEEIRRMTCNMLVDSGSFMLCINEYIQEYLQFPLEEEKRKAQTADGRIIECDVVKGVELKFKNRSTNCRAMVLPGDSEPLMGAIPLEDLDVMIHPLRNELIVNPDSPDVAMTRI